MSNFKNFLLGNYVYVSIDLCGKLLQNIFLLVGLNLPPINYVPSWYYKLTGLTVVGDIGVRRVIDFYQEKVLAIK